MHLPKKRTGKKKLLLLLSIFLSVVAIGAVTFLLPRSSGGEAPEEVAPVITYSTDTPDEERPAEGYTWKGSKSDPKKINIPSLGIDGYIQNVGVDQNKEVAVPNNIHLAGWFVDSVRPGDKGLSIIDGHLNGPSANGIFIDLEKVKEGATFTIGFGDDSKRTFVVKNVQTVALEEAASILFSQDPTIARQLNLITCGGTYDRGARLYDKRVIVKAALVEND